MMGEVVGVCGTHSSTFHFLMPQSYKRINLDRKLHSPSSTLS